MNKKKIFGFLAVMVIAAVAVWNLSLGLKKSDLSNVSLANIEALASSEKGCISRPNDNDGDCTTDGTFYFCENSWWIDDCVKGEYPN
jgi:hypothetical protein